MKLPGCLAAQAANPNSSGLVVVAGPLLSGKPIRFPHGAVCPVATVRPATFHLKVLQIGQINDYAKGKDYSPPH
jgi:hypothetical protein